MLLKAGIFVFISLVIFGLVMYGTIRNNKRIRQEKEIEKSSS